jgi:hypothetical protein
LKVCPECFAENPPSAGRCWMCHADVGRVKPIGFRLPQTEGRQPVFAPSAWFFALLTLLTIALVILVGWGLGEISYGHLGWFGVIVITGLAATTVRIGSHRLRGDDVTWSEAIASVFAAAATVLGVLGLVALATVACLFLVCLISPPRFGH